MFRLDIKTGWRDFLETSLIKSVVTAKRDIMFLLNEVF